MMIRSPPLEAVMIPTLTLATAKYQEARVASARGLSLKTVTELLMKYEIHLEGALTPQPLVNVLILNMELERLVK
jgi:K+-transporting ATPase c subunit